MSDRSPLAASTSAPAGRQQWLILGVISIAQLMVVLDSTIVNIALPAAQTDLAFDDAQRQWVVTAYSLAFGSLLLIGGRLNDMFGSKLGFLVGLVGFAAASALGGWAPSYEVLIVARAAQGAFGALLAPAALAMLTVTFAASSDRGKAFGIFGAVAGSGAAVGLLLGGTLTEYLSWRWCLYVNVFFAVLAVIGGLRLLPANERESGKMSFDWPGSVLAVAGIFFVVFGFARSETEGWSDPVTLAGLIAGIGLVIGFVVAERLVRHPLLPMNILLDRVRGTSYLVMLIAAIGMFAVFLFVTFYVQQVLGYTPITSGFAFLPMVVAIGVSAQFNGTPAFQNNLGPKIQVGVGALLAAAGMLLFTGFGADSSYLTALLPGLVLSGLGLGCIFAVAMGSSTMGVEAHQAGVASATVNTAQQVGGSIGVALLSSVSASAATDYAASHATAADVMIQAQLAAYDAVFIWSAVFFAAAALVAFVLYPSRRVTAQMAAQNENVAVHM
ncbi:MFS transporter [Kineosporia mesophila]|uniref:MFS transporter n=1 Tax=Kineosporia mesophila TaxID=566012 RepID=A0ABP6YZ60_9ACTN|nr:DHA2 family efflux MFS transporter permease subunit [Kineosporia mesophila]MCD5351109.1 DHA2 family efflux MFS transporter permease subunit [Kineosporia mesophila]